MSSLQISQGTFRLSDTKTLKIEHLTVGAGESWAFVGSNGSGKSALARALSGELTLLSGQYENRFSRVTRLSFEQLQKLVSDEWQRNNTDLLSPGEEDTGRTTEEIIQEESKDAARCARLAELFGITSLLQRRFKYLSTGETRKTLLCQALMTQPDLLILDEPFDGLDVASRQQLAGLLARLHLEGLTLVLVLNRFDEIPSFVQFAGVLADCTLSETGEKQALLQQALSQHPDAALATLGRLCADSRRLNPHDEPDYAATLLSALQHAFPSQGQALINAAHASEPGLGRWLARAWQGKVAAGFTNGGGLSGDKLAVLQQINLFAMQHGMLWAGLPMMPTGRSGQDLNRMSSFLGLMTQSDNAPVEVTPPTGDLNTAIWFGEYLALTLNKFK